MCIVHPCARGRINAPPGLSLSLARLCCVGVCNLALYDIHFQREKEKDKNIERDMRRKK